MNVQVLLSIAIGLCAGDIMGYAICSGNIRLLLVSLVMFICYLVRICIE